MSKMRENFIMSVVDYDDKTNTAYSVCELLEFQFKHVSAYAAAQFICDLHANHVATLDNVVMKLQSVEFASEDFEHVENVDVSELVEYRKRNDAIAA